jgi:hypothetical protein
MRTAIVVQVCLYLTKPRLSRNAVMEPLYKLKNMPFHVLPFPELVCQYITSSSGERICPSRFHQIPLLR